MSDGLEGKLAIAIVREAGMSARPEYYSGRGATISDLNEETLERIYAGIKRTRGADAAAQYVQMVADIPVLSATDFLVTLYTLEARDWKWDKDLIGDQNGVWIDGKTDREKYIVGVCTIASGFGSGADMTARIRSAFLARHGIAPKASINKFGF